MANETDTAKPTNVRYAVLGITTLSAVLLYLDRLCMAEIVKTDSFRESITADKDQIGSVLGAFFLAYALFQVPAGWLSDRFGARGMMSFYIGAWSFFTALSGWAHSLNTLLVARIGLGLAQAGAYPTSGSLLSRWMPFSMRGLSSSVVAFGGRIGGAAAPVITILLVHQFGNWRPVLIVYGVLGIAAAVAFWYLFREKPEEHPQCNEAERALIGTNVAGAKAKPVFPLLPLLTNRSLWCNCVAQFGTNVGWVFLVTWLPTYLKDVKHVDERVGGLMTTLALFLGMGGMLLGGWLTDYATRKMGARWGRSVPLAITRFVAAAAYVSCLWLESPWALTTAFALVALSTDLGTASTWAFMQDIGGRHVGSIFGWGNMWGNLGAAATSKLLPWLLLEYDVNHDWHEAFWVCAGGFILSGVAALGMDATTPIAAEENKA
ncbi:MAG: MFS transporter [Verrucomicrobiota bacterium]